MSQPFCYLGVVSINQLFYALIIAHFGLVKKGGVSGRTAFEKNTTLQLLNSL
jgi:hypothetical protein